MEKKEERLCRNSFRGRHVEILQIREKLKHATLPLEINLLKTVFTNGLLKTVFIRVEYKFLWTLIQLHHFSKHDNIIFIPPL